MIPNRGSFAAAATGTVGAAARMTGRVSFSTEDGPQRREAGARWSLVAPAWLTAVVLAGVAAYRTVVIGSHGEPSGLDFGIRLTLGYQILGHPLAGAAVGTYPPIVPVLTVGVTWALGVVWGTALLAGLSSTAPALGAWFACRLFGARWTALLAAVLLAATSSSGEAAAWGASPSWSGSG